MCESRIKAPPYPFGSITESKIRCEVVGIVCESRINAPPTPFKECARNKCMCPVGAASQGPHDLVGTVVVGLTRPVTLDLIWI